MDIDWDTVETVLEDAAGVVEKVAPLAAAGGPLAGSIGGLIGAAATFAGEALQAAQAEGSVISATSLASVQASQKTIQAANDAAFAQIAKD